MKRKGYELTKDSYTSIKRHDCKDLMKSNQKRNIGRMKHSGILSPHTKEDDEN